MLTGAIEARDPYTRGHSTRVTELAEALACALGWSEERIASLRLGGPLHDIGKLAVSHEVLHKEGELDAAELAEIREQREEDLGDARIELRSRAAVDLGQRFVPRQRAPVGAVARHRVERVGDGEHARLERDLLPRLAGRVTGAIPTLVVVEHVRDRPAQRRGLPRAVHGDRAPGRSVGVARVPSPCLTPG